MSTELDNLLLSTDENDRYHDSIHGIEKLSEEIEGALVKVGGRKGGKGSKEGMGLRKSQSTPDEVEKRRKSEASLQAALEEALQEEKALFSRGRPSKNTAAGNTAARIREIAEAHGVTKRSLLRAYRRKVITADTSKVVKKGRRRILADDIEEKLASFVRFLNLMNIPVSTMQLRQISSKITAVCGKKALKASNHWASDFKNRYGLKGSSKVKGGNSDGGDSSSIKKSFTEEQLTEIVAALTGMRADSSEGAVAAASVAVSVRCSPLSSCSLTSGSLIVELSPISDGSDAELSEGS